VSFRVLGVGEVRWDLLPAGAQPGGAAANALANEVSCHVCGGAGAAPSLPPRLAGVFAPASPNPSVGR